MRFDLVLLVSLALVLHLALGQNVTADKKVKGRKKLRDNASAVRVPGKQKIAPAGKKPGSEKKAIKPLKMEDTSMCEEIFLPMCKGLVPYTHTRLPNTFNHTTQMEVFRHISHMSVYLDFSCSKNLRLMVCSLYLPKCKGRQPGIGPCKSTCMQAKKGCEKPLNEFLGLKWEDKFDCSGLSNKKCLKAVKDENCSDKYPTCVKNSVIKTCANLTFTMGTLPNMFGQCLVNEINAEIDQYDKLVASNCHPSLRFFLCGVYAPFCGRTDVPPTFPCRELCHEVRTACEKTYRQLYHGLPWPSKFQCHRYTASDSTSNRCAMPNEGENFLA
ncbi:atrial natriuretic peptide-converting enzyme-like [Physella acuta]|uniref:atrial natriuretic peptide-converting enzyme-like n=1 Tax=Physella acuta TaxID=109671 RepID=UPI0027DC74FC|nr:atrial natriuretic peptide-converting enzyme-like [Physella acuta]XP_059141331.1 atrial natriuretic peptide-converting enzyme-like [Physella acuta]XP_059141341.1 atrial natriuretic peptide-converting enzyme-like [Physella acuta]